MKNELSRRRAYMTVLGAFLLATGGGFGGAFAMFYLPVAAERGFTQAGLAGYVTIMSVCGIFSQPFVGGLLTRYRGKIRLIGMLGAVMGFACCFWFSRCDSLGQFYAGGAAISLMVPIVNGNLGGSAVTSWFDSKRGKAISIISVGTSVGTVFYSQLVRIMIERYGWREAYVGMGVFMFLITALGTALISAPPETYGLLPYGAGEGGAGEQVGEAAVSLREMVKMPAFWLLSLCALFASAYIMGVQQSVTSLLQVDYCFTPALAAALLSVYSIVCAASKFLMGVIYDRYGPSAAMLTVCAAVCVSLTTLVLSDSFAAALTAMVIYGAGNMFGTVILSAYIAEVFGGSSFSGVFGYVSIFFTVGVGIGPLLAGWSFDISGSYKGAYVLFVVFCLCSTVLLLLSGRCAKTGAERRNRKSANAGEQCAQTAE